MGIIRLPDGTRVDTGFLKKTGGSAGSGGVTVRVAPRSGGTNVVLSGGGKSRTIRNSKKTVVVRKDLSITGEETKETTKTKTVKPQILQTKKTSERVTVSRLTRVTPERKSFGRATFEKLGFKVSEDEKGGLVAIKDGEKVTLSREGFAITPETAKVQTKFFKSLETQRQKEKSKTFSQRTFEKLGFKVKNKKGVLVATKGDQKVIISKEGSAIVPKSAKVNLKQFKRLETQRQKQKKKDFIKNLPFLKRQLFKIGEKQQEIFKSEAKVILKQKKLSKEQQLISNIQGLAVRPPRPEINSDLVKQRLKFQKQLIGLSLKSGVVGALDFGRHPIKNLGETYNLIKSPEKRKEFIISFEQQVKKNPLGLVAEIIAFEKTIGTAGSLIKKSPVGKAVSTELFILRQEKAIRPFLRKIIKSSKIQNKINPTNIKTIKTTNFLDVKSLTTSEAKALAQTLPEIDHIVFGSKGARVLSKGKTKLPKDVDIAVGSIEKFNKLFLEKLTKAERSKLVIKAEKIVRKGTGETVLDVKPFERLVQGTSRLSRAFGKKGSLPISTQRFKSKFLNKINKKFSFESKIKSLRSKITDLKQLPKTKKNINKLKKLNLDLNNVLKKKKKLKISISELPEFETGIGVTDIGLTTGKPVKIGKIKFTSFGEQTTRKGLGTIQVLIERNILRAKDPQGFVNSLVVQIEGLKKVKPSTKLGKLSNTRKIKKLEEAVKILTSKEFEKLLNQKVPGLTKEFPLLEKIDTKKLSKVKVPETKPKTKPKLKKGGIEKTKSKIKIESKKGSKQKVSKLSRSRVPSKVPISRLSKIPSSKLSKIPPSKLSKIPPSRLSKIPPIKLSKIPPSRLSKLPPSKLSKLPPIKLSKIPPSRLSKLPPSKLSKVPISRLSKIPRSKLSKVPVKKTKKTVPPKKKFKSFKKQIKKRKVKGKKQQITKFTRTIQRSKKKFKKLKQFTGLELR